MFLVQRWDNVVIERTNKLERALEIAEQESTTRETTIDVVEHWIEWPEDKLIARYRDGHLIPLG